MRRCNVVTIEVVATERIDDGTWDEIWNLSSAFHECERDYSEGMLRKRQRIALVRDRTHRALVGMATIDTITTTFDGRALTALFTSHVLLLEAYRGLNLFQRIGFKAFLAARLRHPLRPIYWFFDTFSYKSYLLLPKNFREFWPRRDCPTPEPVAALIDHLATHIYGADWQPYVGMVVASGRMRLRESIAPVTPAVAQMPDVEFFARLNPGHAIGDMLVCICPLSAQNWWCAGTRVVARVYARWRDSDRTRSAKRPTDI